MSYLLLCDLDSLQNVIGPFLVNAKSCHHRFIGLGGFVQYRLKSNRHTICTKKQNRCKMVSHTCKRFTIPFVLPVNFFEYVKYLLIFFPPHCCHLTYNLSKSGTQPLVRWQDISIPVPSAHFVQSDFNTEEPNWKLKLISTSCLCSTPFLHLTWSWAVLASCLHVYKWSIFSVC